MSVLPSTVMQVAIILITMGSIMNLKFVLYYVNTIVRKCWEENVCHPKCRSPGSTCKDIFEKT